MSLLGNIWVKLGLKSDDFNKGLDNAERKTSKFGEAMKRIAGKVLTVAAAFKVLKGTFETLTNFEASTSKLASVLGKTTTEIKGLTQSAIDLGRKTQYTASEVVSLQTELAKLGFTEPQIKSMQESVLKFAAAVGTDLPSAAARAGATMRGFGLTAEETADMLNVMAVSTSKSALSFNYLDSTLGKLVPVTKAYGFDVRDTITLLGTMANAGIDASSAGTALRRMFVELSNGSSKLNNAIGKQPKTMEELIDALDVLNKKNLSVADSADLVGKYAAPAFAALVAGAANCRELYVELGNANGALNTMYETMTYNVQGAVKELGSAWEAFILNLQSSNGVIARMLRGLTQLVNLADRLMFRNTRVGENKSFFDLLWNGKGGFDDNSFNAVQMRFAKERQRLEKSLGMTAEGTKSWKDIKEQLEGLEASEAEWFQTVIEKANEADGVLGGLGDTVADDNNELLELLKNIDKKSKKEKKAKTGIINELEAEIEKKKELRDMSKDEVEIFMLNAEIERLEKKLQALRGITKEQLKLKQITEAEAERLTGMSNDQLASDIAEMDSMLGDALKDFNKKKEKAEDIAQGFAEAIRGGVVGALDELAEALGTGNFDSSALVKALISPLADAAISAGTLIMTTGKGLKALKTALLDLFGGGPYAAIFAGGALIAAGVAAKAGLAAIVNNGAAGAGGGSDSYSYAGGYGVTLPQGTGQMELVGTVTVKGQDLQIALDNYNRNRGR